MTKRNTEIMNQYLSSRYTDLNSAYTKCSYKKQRAWEYCQNLCKDNNGTGLKVMSKNTYTFTAGFTFTKDGHNYLMYITPSRDEAIALN